MKGSGRLKIMDPAKDIRESPFHWIMRMALLAVLCLGLVAFGAGLCSIVFSVSGYAQQSVPIELADSKSAVTVAVVGCLVASYAAVVSRLQDMTIPPKRTRRPIGERAARHVTARVGLALLSISGILFLVGLHSDGHQWPPASLPSLLVALPLILLSSMGLLVVGPGIGIRLLATVPFVLSLAAFLAAFPFHQVKTENDLVSALLGVGGAVFAVIVSYPCVVLAAVLAIRRTAGFKGSLCSECGYDLAGNVSGACPECGSRVRVRRELR